MNVLYDDEDNEVVLMTKADTLAAAVQIYLKKNKYWELDEFYNDGKIVMSGEQYFKSGYYKHDFRLILDEDIDSDDDE